MSRTSVKVASVLFSAASLPRTDQLRIAAGYRFDVEYAAARGDAALLGRRLRICERHARRLIAAYAPARKKRAA